MSKNNPQRDLWSVRGPQHWSENPPVEVLLTQSQVDHFYNGVQMMEPNAEIVLVAWVAPWRAGERGVRRI